jgi:hypothetical protein
MSIGMSYDEFWNQDVALVRTYLKAKELRDKQRNQEMWLQGMYFYEALCDASPLFRFSMKKGQIKPEPYVKEPYPITKEEVEAREERERQKQNEQLKAAFAAFAERIRDKMPSEARPGMRGGENNG